MSQKMTTEEYQGVVNALISDAVDYIDLDVAPRRAAAIALYDGRPFGDEGEGRSQVVITEARDTVNQMLPSLLRTFTNADRPYEVTPRNEREVEVAREQTDALSYFMFEKNPGYDSTYNSFKDGLVSNGIYHWWYEEVPVVRSFTHTNMTEFDIAIYKRKYNRVRIVSKVLEEPAELPTTAQADPNTPVMDLIAEQEVDRLFAPLEQLGQTPVDVPTYTIKVLRTVMDPRIKWDALPPETFFISRDARCVDSALCVGRRQIVTVSDLIAIGYDQDEIEAHAGSATQLSYHNDEAEMRNPAIDDGTREFGDPALRKVLYTEAWIRIDKDGDGIAELRKVCAIGESYHILDEGEADEVWEDDTPPFSILNYDPIPHTALGNSLCDMLQDLQRIKSNVVRNTLDSLANAIHPSTVVVEGQANLDDVMNPEVGKIIRARQQGAVQELTKTFVGQQSMPILSYLDQIREARTGMTMASQGLNGDELQSTTAMAVSAQMSASQQRLEMVARNWAEGPIRRLCLGVLRLIQRHISEETELYTRDGFRKINPTTWPSDLPIAINVGLGKGSTAERLQMLTQVLGVQRELLGASLDNPMVGPSELWNTLSTMLELGGVKDVTKFFKRPPPGWRPPQQNQQVDPNVAALQVNAQVEALKANVQRDKFQAEDQFNWIKLHMEDARERDRMDREFELKRAELEARWSAQVDQAMIKADTAMRQMETDRAMHEATGEQNLAASLAGLYADSLTSDADRQAARLDQAAQALAAAPEVDPTIDPNTDPNSGGLF